MKKILFLTITLFILSFNTAAQDCPPLCGGPTGGYTMYAYGYSQILFDDNAPQRVSGITGTYLVFFGYPDLSNEDYDPWVHSGLYRTDPPWDETPLSEGELTGFRDIVSAEGYHPTFSAVSSKTYCVYSSHAFIRYWRIWGSVWTSQRRNFGNTEECHTFPAMPTPTPNPTPSATPTPPPSPTPTPCGGFATGSKACGKEQILIAVGGSPLKPLGTRGGTKRGGVAVVVFNEKGVGIPNRTIELKVMKSSSDTGGHFDLHHNGIRPVGTLEKTRGTTGTNGIFSTTYNPPHISGHITIEAKSGNLTVRKEVLVGLLGLIQLTEGENLRLIGSDSPHPGNHWGSVTTVTAIERIANAYKQEFYKEGPMPENDKLRINDISLIFGGKFDLASPSRNIPRPNWHNLSAVHKYHREGNSVDMRCCTSPGQIPSNRHEAFRRLVLNNGATSFLREFNPDHFHLSFNGEANNFGDPEDPLNTHTTSSFVTNTFETVFDRLVTQDEYESWNERLLTAKAQNNETLLAEAKIFKSTLFSESEYVARHRTDEEFVSDVFLACLFRESTGEESAYWQSYLQNLPPSLPQNRRRARLLGEIALLAEFENLVYGIVEGEVIMPPLPTP